MNKGDKVYAIVKNRNFKLEIIEAIIEEITDYKVIVSKRHTPVETNVYTFLKDKVKNFVFYTLDEANCELDKIR
jgi:hypothetical protein